MVTESAGMRGSVARHKNKIDTRGAPVHCHCSCAGYKIDILTVSLKAFFFRGFGIWIIIYADDH